MSEIRGLKLGLSFIPMDTLPRISFYKEMDFSFRQFFRLLRLRFSFRNNVTDSVANVDRRSVFNRKLYVPNRAYEPRSESPVLEQYIFLTTQIYKAHRDNCSSLPFTNIPLRDRQAVRKLGLRPDVVIARADKNLGIVLLNSTDYCKKVFDHLLDTNTYRCLTDKEASKCVADFLAQFTTLRKDHPSIFRQHSKFFSIYEQNWKYATFYLLIKIHKTPIVGRPIVASHSWITTGLSKWIDLTLNPIVTLLHSKSVLKDTISFVRLIEDLHIPTDDIMLVTLDVKNLYPSIPIDEGQTCLQNSC